MAGTILLIIALVFCALLLLAVEICTPTFGLLALAAMACLTGAVYQCFVISQVFGVVMIVVLAFAIPVYLWAMIKYLPKTPIGSILQLRARRRAPGEGTPDAAELESLVGDTGVAETSLRPSGAIRVNHKRIVAMAEAGFIEKGATVEIIQAGGADVVVREVLQNSDEAV